MEHKLEDRVIDIVLNELYTKPSPFPTIYSNLLPILKSKNIHIDQQELMRIMYVAQAKNLLSTETDLNKGGFVVNITDYGILVINQHGSFLSYLDHIIAEKKLNDDRDAQFLRQSGQIEKSEKDMVALTAVVAFGTVSLGLIEIVRMIVDHWDGFVAYFCDCH